MRSLDLGCGTVIRNPYFADELYGVDVVDLGEENIKVADLAIEPIPFEDNFFDYVTAYDFLEHVPRTIYFNNKRIHPFINVMSEIHRVLRPGGIFKAQTPAFPHGQAFQDPTHVNIISTNTLMYFVGGFDDIASEYGFQGKFKYLDQYWNHEHPSHLMWEISAIKDES
jgi:SAM-dependent methyltransferase